MAANERYLDPVARLLDPRRRELEPAAGDGSCVAGSVKSVDEATRSITVVVSTASPDRYEEIVEPSAYKRWLPKFLENPVFLAGHQHVGFDAAKPTTIGHWREMRITDDGLVGTCVFASTDLANEYWSLYRDGHQRGFSVGFLVHEWEWREFEAAPGITKRIRVFTEVELIEVSAVAVPANRDAIVRAASALGVVRAGLPEALSRPGVGDAALDADGLTQLIKGEIAQGVTAALNPEPGSPLMLAIEDAVAVALESKANLSPHASPADPGGDAEDGVADLLRSVVDA
ncbi:MAG: HK97 family phage prohead protease [Planctomycetota bacterium]